MLNLPCGRASAVSPHPAPSAITMPAMDGNNTPPPTLVDPSDGRTAAPTAPVAPTAAVAANPMPPSSRPEFVPPQPVGAAEPNQILAAKPPAPPRRKAAATKPGKRKVAADAKADATPDGRSKRKVTTQWKKGGEREDEGKKRPAMMTFKNLWMPLCQLARR